MHAAQQRLAPLLLFLVPLIVVTPFLVALLALLTLLARFLLLFFLVLVPPAKKVPSFATFFLFVFLPVLLAALCTWLLCFLRPFRSCRASLDYRS